MHANRGNMSTFLTQSHRHLVPFVIGLVLTLGLTNKVPVTRRGVEVRAGRTLLVVQDWSRKVLGIPPRLWTVKSPHFSPG